MKTSPILILAIAALFSTSLDGQQINVEVPVLHQRQDSRPSHFNWEFESSGGEPVRIGQFACGSYWVAPAEGDSGVTLISLTGNPAWNDLLSCDADPIPESHGLLDGSNNYGSYNAAENVLAELPVTFTPAGDSCISLVAAMQRNESETSNAGTKGIVGEAVDAYCVVTVMPAPPANGGSDMIRPNITGASKEFLTWDDFDLDRLPVHPFIPDNSASGWENVRLRWSHSTEIFGGFAAETSPGEWTSFSEGGRAFRAHNLTHDYGSTMASAFNNDVLALFTTSDTPDEKMAALAAILSFGLDIYHARYNYGTAARKAWLSGAGQQAGKFLPAAFLAALLEDETKAHQLRKVAIHKHSEDPALQGPQELRQITRGVTGVPLWGDGVPFLRDGNTLNLQDRRYWSNLRASRCYDTALGTCDATDGKKTIADPYGYIDGPAEQPGSNYMSVTFGVYRSLAGAMILMPELRSVVNTDIPIEYVDRCLRHGLWTAPDPVAPVPIVDQQNDCDPWRNQNCSEYQITWGPNPDDVRFAIEDGTGRFVSMNGQPLPNLFNDGTRARDHWASIIALYDGTTFQETAVALGTLVAPDILFETGSTPRAHLRSPHVKAEIRYTVDGTDPDESSALYTDPIPVAAGTEIRARAFQEGMTASAVAQDQFDFSLPDPDGEAPSAPTGLQANGITAHTVDLGWNAATDNIGVAGYKVYADGNHVANVVATDIQATGLAQNTSYIFTVSAYDAAGNESPRSSGVQVTTTSAPVAPVVVAVEASEEQSSNTAAHTTDDDFATRWAAAGDPQWILWELDQEYTLLSVGLGFHNGDSRSYPFELEVSLDGANWTQVYSGQSSGTTSEMETFDVGEASARYVRYVGHGSSANTWNSLTEVDFTAAGPSVRTWGDGVALESGAVDTLFPLGWLHLHPGSAWAWSYSLAWWIYAPDPGPGASGAWIYAPVGE